MRVRNRPALLALTLALAAALLLAACGGDGSGGGGSDGTPPAAIKVFAAASLTSAFNAMAEPFQAAHPGVKVTFNFAGSQQLAAQVQQGAPADVFAAADQANLGKVADLVDAPQVFARNELRIVVAKGNPKEVRGLADLAREDLIVVLAAPEVPAGRYARQALDAQKVTVAPRSLEENVKGVVSKVALGSADAGIVYVTDVLAGGDKIEGVPIPARQNVPAEYPIAVVKASKQLEAARAFVAFARSPQGQGILQRFGFGAGARG